MLKTRKEIQDWLKFYKIEIYKINEDLTVDIDEDVVFTSKLNTINIQFNFIKGNFDCSYCDLKSLVGGPKFVTGDFICFNNKLETLEGCPIIVRKNFNCEKNELKILHFMPEKIGGKFYCDRNVLLGDLQFINDIDEIKIYILKNNLENKLNINQLEKNLKKI